jgi:hypothetical protein
MDDTVYNEPSETQVVDGNVALMGPDGVSVIMTPEAALETSDRLHDTAAMARGQQIRAQQVQQERGARGGDNQ